MKQSILFLFLTLICSSLSFGQVISIDSTHVYSTGNVIDSVYVRGFVNFSWVHSLSISTTPLNDSCNTLETIINVKGCGPSIALFYDTIIEVNLTGNRLNIFTRWDTLQSCSPPIAPIYSDTASWDNCNALVLGELLDGSLISVYPNPAIDFLQVDLPEYIKLEYIELLGRQGDLLKIFAPTDRRLDIQNLSQGVYFLKLETEAGIIVEKVVVR